MGNDGIFSLTIENDRRANDRRKNYRTPWDSIVLVKKFLCLPKTIVSQALFFNGCAPEYEFRELLQSRRFHCSFRGELRNAQ